MIYLGADHGGFELKNKAIAWIKELGMEVTDLGSTSLDPTDDFPIYAHAVATQVLQNPLNRGLLFCRSGAGMVIAANKHAGIRAADVFDAKSARQAREHLDANVASLSGDWMEEAKAHEAIETFLTTMFSEEERYKRRIEQLEKF